MKISTSASFVVASLALSSSGLALPTPDSPDLTASPKSAKVAQMADFSDSIADNNSPISRRMLPRRGLKLRETDESYDKAAEGAAGELPSMDSLSMLLGRMEEDLESGHGLGLSKLKAKRDAYASPDLSARQVPPNTPQPPPAFPFSPPSFPTPPSFPAPPVSAPAGVSAPVPGAAGVPAMATGQVYPYYGMAGSNVPISPPGVPGPVQSMYGNVPMAAEHAAEAGFPDSQVSAPFSPMEMLPGPVGQTIQGTPVGGIVYGIPLGSAPGVPGQVIGQVSYLPSTVGSTAGQIGGSVPGPAGGTVQGIPNPMQQVSNTLPVSGLMSSVPFLGADQARDAASADDVPVTPSSPSSTVATPSSSPDPAESSSPSASPVVTDSPVSSPVPTDSASDIASEDPTATSTTTGDASGPTDSGVPLPDNVENIPSAPVAPPSAPTGSLPIPQPPVSAPSPPGVPVPVAPPSLPVSGGAPAPPTNGTAGAPVPPTLPSPPIAPVKAKRDLMNLSLPSGFAVPSKPISGDIPILLGTGGAKDASDPADPSTTDDDVSANATVAADSSDPSATSTDTGAPASPTSSVGSASPSDQSEPLLPSPTGSPTASDDAPAPTSSTLSAAKKRMSRFFRFKD